MKRPSSISPKPDNRNLGYNSQNNSNYQSSGYNDNYNQINRKPIVKGPGPPPSRQGGQIRPTGPPQQKRDPTFNRQPAYQNRQGPGLRFL